MKTEISPMWLTYFMVKWGEVEQYDTADRCTDCGRTMKRTEAFIGPKGVSFEGYVCHTDKRVTWLKVG